MAEAKGPLEDEIHRLWEQATKSDPTVHALVQGRLTPADLKKLGVDERQLVNNLNARMFGATRHALARLAQEIDALRAAADGGNEPSDAS